MIQLQILSGKLAGREIVVRQFPFTIGRSADCDLRLDDAGVWDRHLKISFQAGDGFHFVSHDSGLTILNGVEEKSGILRNGNRIELGEVKLLFWLARSEQKGLRGREALTWAGLFGLLAFQIGLICVLLR